MRNEPDKYVDKAEEGGEEGGGAEMSEHERYESLCRAPWPIVSAVGSVPLSRSSGTWTLLQLSSLPLSLPVSLPPSPSLSRHPETIIS